MEGNEDFDEDYLTAYAVQLSIQESTEVSQPESTNYQERYCKFMDK